MTVSLSLPPQVEARLRQRAAAEGKDVGQFVQQLIEREVDAPLSLIGAAEPIAGAVEAAGVSDDEFTSLVEQARIEARAERKRRE
jgi:hypothetical protein